MVLNPTPATHPAFWFACFPRQHPIQISGLLPSHVGTKTSAYNCISAAKAPKKNEEIQVTADAKVLDYIISEEGVIRKTATGFSYEYNLKDLLGYTRAVFSAGNSAPTPYSFANLLANFCTNSSK